MLLALVVGLPVVSVPPHINPLAGAVVVGVVLDRIDAIENYSDSNGTRQWIYGRWYTESGRPNGDVQKHVADELEEVGE